MNADLATQKPSGRTSAGTPHALAALVERIAKIEGRVTDRIEAGRTSGPLHLASAHDATASQEMRDPLRVCTGWPEIDAALGGGIPRRGVHEWWHAEDRADARAAPIDALIQLAWQALLHDEHHHPDEARYIVWVGRAVWPHAQALVRGLRVGARALFGAPCPRLWPDARLVDRSLLVETAGVKTAGANAALGHAVNGAAGNSADRDAPMRLWAIEQAARCSGVCAVIADGAGFDLAATRRLQLAATDVLLLLARPHERRTTLSACTTRWRVRRAEQEIRAVQSGTLADRTLADRIPHEPTWVVELERAKGLASTNVCALTAGTRITRTWELDGVSAPPSTLVAEATRRRAKKITRMAAQAAEVVARRRRDQEMPHEPAANYPVLPSHHAAGVVGVVRPHAPSAMVHALDAAHSHRA